MVQVGREQHCVTETLRARNIIACPKRRISYRQRGRLSRADCGGTGSQTAEPLVARPPFRHRPRSDRNRPPSAPGYKPNPRRSTDSRSSLVPEQGFAGTRTVGASEQTDPIPISEIRHPIPRRSEPLGRRRIATARRRRIAATIRSTRVRATTTEEGQKTGRQENGDEKGLTHGRKLPGGKHELLRNRCKPAIREILVATLAAGKAARFASSGGAQGANRVPRRAPPPNESIRPR